MAKSSVRLRIEMSLEKLKASNFLMQGAARALVKRFDGDLLVFEAEGEAANHPWKVAGNARAGQVDVPMSVEATPEPGDDPSRLLLGGSVTMNDISIPIPGLSGISSITFSLDGSTTWNPVSWFSSLRPDRAWRTLRPALAEWLDKNLPAMVEKMVAAEIARIAGKRG